jgi:hypothetical protein
MSELTRARLERGPWVVFFYDMASGRLMDRTHDPGVFVSTALGQMMNDRLDIAQAALEAAGMNSEDDYTRTYLSALVAWGLGDSALAKAWFAKVPRGLGRQGGEAGAIARQRLVTGDTALAVAGLRTALAANVLNPGLHATLADLVFQRPETGSEGEVEAFAARVLDPGSPAAWRRWAIVLAKENRQRESIAALDRYLALRPRAAMDDPDALRLRALQQRMLPGGDLAQQSMKKELQR